MKLLLPLPILCLLLAACGALTPPLPDEPDININGSYTGRIVGDDQRSALLDVTLTDTDSEKFVRRARTFSSTRRGQAR